MVAKLRVLFAVPWPTSLYVSKPIILYLFLLRSSYFLDNAKDIISMTANAFPEDWSRCLNAGMCTYLPKPVKRDTLNAELNKAYLYNHSFIISRSF